MKWRMITEDRYTEMLEILPPALWLSKGFLVGEPWTHRVCKVTGQLHPVYAPFLNVFGKHYEGDEPMSLPEFRAYRPTEVDLFDDHQPALL